MGEYDDLPYIVIERRSGGVTPFFWGALIGAGVALFLAPRSGEETQEELRQGVRRLRMAAEDRVDGARSTVMRTRSRVQDQIDAARDVVESRAAQARQAMEAGRRAAREARNDLERRVADAKHSYAAGADAAGMPAPRGRPAPPTDVEADVVITEVVIEEEEGRPGLG